MALKRSADTERSDHSTQMAGSTGENTLQDRDGKLVIRSGASAAESDLDVIKNGNGDYWDLIGDGDFVIPGDTPRDRDNNPHIGGTSRLAGGIVSVDNNSFRVTVKWYDENDTVLLSEEYNSSTETSFGSNQAVQFDRLWTKGDYVLFEMTDTSGGAQNNIHGSLNFHI